MFVVFDSILKVFLIFLVYRSPCVESAVNFVMSLMGHGKEACDTFQVGRIVRPLLDFGRVSVSFVVEEVIDGEADGFLRVGVVTSLEWVEGALVTVVVGREERVEDLLLSRRGNGVHRGTIVGDDRGGGVESVGEIDYCDDSG